MKKFIYNWLPVFFWCGVIFGFSSIPTTPKTGFIWWDFILKKTAHIIEYGILYFLIFRAITDLKFKIQNLKGKIEIQKSKLNKLKFWTFPLLFGLFYALTDEYHQLFVMGRTARIRDVGFDLLGMLASMWWIKKNSKFKIQKSK
jgi:VanZ family protein